MLSHQSGISLTQEEELSKILHLDLSQEDRLSLTTPMPFTAARIQELRMFSSRYQNIFSLTLEPLNIPFADIQNFYNNTPNGIDILEAISCEYGRAAIETGTSFAALGRICTELGPQELEKCLDSFMRIGSETLRAPNAPPNLDSIIIYYIPAPFEIMRDDIKFGFERFAKTFTQPGGFEKLRTVLSRDAQLMIKTKKMDVNQAFMLYNVHPKAYTKNILSMKDMPKEEVQATIKTIKIASNHEIKAASLENLHTTGKRTPLGSDPAYNVGEFLTAADVRNAAIASGKTAFTNLTKQKTPQELRKEHPHLTRLIQKRQQTKDEDKGKIW